MKKAWRGLKNQMFVNDYWKKIINEIILLKESDIKIDDSAILVGGGGSEPCLGAADAPLDEAGDDLYNVRRVVSAGNIQVELQMKAIRRFAKISQTEKIPTTAFTLMTL